MAGTRSMGMHVRVNPDIKAQVEPILDAIGLTFSDVFNLTLNQIYLKKKIPFDLCAVQLTENGFTPEFEAEILRESEELHQAVLNGTRIPYNSARELFAALEAEIALEEDDE